jgi:hypothetical protein
VAIPTSLLPHTVTVQTPDYVTDRYNTATVVPDWSSPAEQTISARLEMVTGRSEAQRETTAGRSDAVGTWRIFTNDEITMHDRIVFGDLTFDVDGPVKPAYGASATPHHYEATLRAR